MLLQSIGLSTSDLANPKVAKMIFEAVNTIQEKEAAEEETVQGSAVEATASAEASADEGDKRQQGESSQPDAPPKVPYDCFVIFQSFVVVCCPSLIFSS